MKLSECPDYLAFGSARARGNLLEAEQALERCLSTPDLDVPQRAFLLQLLGDVKFNQGDRAGALQRYQDAENLDPNSVVAKYKYAKFLAEKVKNSASAVEKCDEIIHLISTQKCAELGQVDSIEPYLEQAQQLRDRLLSW
jgi:predicted Zn-dependent protease